MLESPAHSRPVPQQQVTHILIINVHSALNLGDDAIMAATLQRIARVHPNRQVTVAAGDPESWRKYDSIVVVPSLAHWGGDPAHGAWRKRLWLLPFQLLVLVGVAIAFRRFHLRPRLGSGWLQQLLVAYYDADVVLSCGGGNFYAYRRFSPAFLWTTLSVAFALWLGKPVTMLPQSFGPIAGKLQRLFLAQVLNRVKALFVRDECSLEFLQTALAGLRIRPHLLPDLAFGLEVTASGSAGLAAHSSPRIHLALTAIDFQRQNPHFQLQAAYEDALVGAARRLAEMHPIQVHVVAQCLGPSCDQDDRVVAARIHARLHEQQVAATLVTEIRDARDLVQYYQLMAVVIGTRMHSGILALTAGVPPVLIGYQPKTQGMMKMVGMSRYVLAIDAISADQLAARIEELLQDRHQLAHTIANRVSELRAQLDLLDRRL